MENLDGKVRTILEKDRNRNINMLNFFRNYPAASVYVCGDSVLARGRSDEDWIYISSASAEEFDGLLQYLGEEDKCFAVLEDWMLPGIVKARKIRSQLTSIKLLYGDGNFLPTGGKAVTELQAGDTEYIYQHSSYKEFISPEYIEERIKNGVGMGIREEGRLVAWALTHDDGAIGFLNVLKEHRRQGYGFDVTAAMVMRLLELEEAPFVHIEETNAKSMNLALKVGFRKDRRVHWIKLE